MVHPGQGAVVSSPLTKIEREVRGLTEEEFKQEFYGHYKQGFDALGARAATKFPVGWHPGTQEGVCKAISPPVRCPYPSRRTKSRAAQYVLSRIGLSDDHSRWTKFCAKGASEYGRQESKRGRVGEGRPTLYTPELANRLADHIAAGLTDEEAAALEDISGDWIQRWRKSNPEFCVTIKRAEAPRLKVRLERIEAGEAGWQGTAWALERIYPKRFARPDVQFAQQINLDSRPNKHGIIMDAETIKTLSDAYDAMHGKKEEPKNTDSE